MPSGLLALFKSSAAGGVIQCAFVLLASDLMPSRLSVFSGLRGTLTLNVCKHCWSRLGLMQ